MIALFSVDITIDEDDRPYLIEINGANSGFDGFLIAYEDRRIQDAISAAFKDLVGDRDVFVVTRLVNFGELPPGYLDKLVQDRLYFSYVQNVHATLRNGFGGTTWARLKTDRPPSMLESSTSLDALVEQDPRFKKVVLNVADPRYVIPQEYFKNQADMGVISFRNEIKGNVKAITLGDEDVVWMRTPNSPAYAEPFPKGVRVMNPEFPYDALADNKWFTCEILSRTFPNNVPVSMPIGNECSGSTVIREMLDRSESSLFIRKPVLGLQARGIEILRREDVQDYQMRLARLEDDQRQNADQLPLELTSVPQLLAARAFSFDISLLSELKPSKPIPCRWTRRYHYGCMRALALVKTDEDKHVEVRYLGAYWRLAPIPVGGDGMLWERYVGSQSQGAFCEGVSADDTAIAERFTSDVLTTYCQSLSTMADERLGYEHWEKEYWLARYEAQAAALKREKTWKAFWAELKRAEDEATRLKHEAGLAGYRRAPSVMLTFDQMAKARLPYLINEPNRILID